MKSGAERNAYWAQLFQATRSGAMSRAGFLIGLMPLAIGFGCVAKPARFPELTMVVDQSLARTGGTVILLPRSDRQMAGNVVPRTVRVTDSFSLVYHDEAADDDSFVRFTVANEIGRDAAKLQTKLLTVGTQSGGNLPDQDYRVFYIYGSRVDEQTSYVRGIHLVDILRQNLQCRQYSGVKVCVLARQK